MSVSTNQRSETRSTWVRNLARFGSVLSVFAMLAFFSGCTPPPCTSDANCDFCDGATCDTSTDPGMCESGTAPCAADLCDEDANVCNECSDTTVCDDGDACTDDACVSGSCTFTETAAAAACDDTDLCSPESCDTATGACVAVDSCDAATEICDPADGTCTTMCAGDSDCDACLGETCGGGGLCAAGTPVDCDDADACTTDTCSAGVCSNDAIVCGAGETCSGGICAVDTSCTSDADCNACLGETCDLVATTCIAGTPIDCDDADNCTTDTCAAGVCSNTAVVCGAGTSCDSATGTCVVAGAFDFTLDDDTLTGTLGDDVFTAGVGTLNPLDIAVGNGGSDVINASIVGVTSGDPTLIQFALVNFTTLNDATFDAANAAAIEAYGAAGGSNGGLTLTNVGNNADGDGASMEMGSGFDQDMTATYTTNPQPTAMLTLNGTADGAGFHLGNADCSTDLTVDVAADSSLTSANPTQSIFCDAVDNLTSCEVTGSGGLTLLDAEPGDMTGDGFDFSGFSGALSVGGSADVGHTFDFSAAGFNYPLDSYTIADTVANAHTVTTQSADHSLTVNIADIDAAASAGALTVNQSTSLTDFDTLNVNLGGEGDGMGALGAANTESINIDSGGTTANAIANVTGASGGFSTPTVTVTGDQDMDCGTVTTDVFNAVDATGDVTATAAAAMSMSGGSGDDDLTGSGGGDSISGNAGDDTLSGLAGSDVLNGGPGDDTIDGGDGADLLTGGTGNDSFILTDDDAIDDISGSPDFEVGADLDEIVIDLGDFSTELGAGVINGEAGGGAVSAGDSTILEAAAGASTGVTGNSETVFKITDTTGLNSNADLTGDFTLSANTANAADAIIVIWYDEDDGDMVISYCVDAGAAADANVDISAGVTDLATIEMTPADFANLDETNIRFRD